MAAFGRKRKARSDESFRLVEGGRVRRIEWDDDDDYDVHLRGERVEREVVREKPVRSFGRREEKDRSEEKAWQEEETISRRRVYRPRHVAPISEIEFEVDHLEMLKAGYRPRGTPAERPDLRPNKRERTLYTTDRGGRVTEAPSSSGRRVLYTGGPSVLSSRRFSERAVDEVIRDVDLDEETTVKETVTEYVPRSKAEGRKTKVVKGKPARKRRRKTKVAAKPAAPAKKEETELQPQCRAMTAAGSQCRNSARHGGKYCGAHKRYRPLTAPIGKSKDTKPHVKGAEDTAPAVASARKSARPAKKARAPATKAAKPAKDDGPQPQCLALTAAGGQCQNSARHGSKYCGAHKGYRAPTATSVLAKAKDTRPRAKGAQDTKPGSQGKKSDDGLQPQCSAVTAAGGQCRNSARGGSKYCGAHKGFNPSAAAKRLTDTKPRSAKGKDTKANVR